MFGKKKPFMNVIREEAIARILRHLLDQEPETKEHTLSTVTEQ